MKNSVFPGELNVRIEIKKKTSTQSPTGAPVDTIELFKSCRAKQIDLRGNEEEDGKIRFLITTEFIVRYDKALTKGKINDMMVVDDEGLEYQIISVIDKIPKRYLSIKTLRRE
ncbi:SPP1 family predicted phage head-tail adaptor [Lutibacter sp. Hel_I_33_5]|uniref:phage head closure protein n=1 Tax=Lutibacter sp. Hel_I_33_5 TaxID=1566289 RepID=UPI0011A801B7|nr:phage head closure protein [Lutibacter sp. Hel_I_33_5]TVZ55602.1 SPP1 family predicted phage head-tail adaptor [Lutibacter sp. Hel_I_33_5]